MYVCIYICLSSVCMYVFISPSIKIQENLSLREICNRKSYIHISYCIYYTQYICIYDLRLQISRKLLLYLY